MAISFGEMCQQQMIDCMKRGKFKAVSAWAKAWGRWEDKQHARRVNRTDAR